VPIPYRDQEDIDGLGYAAFLKVEVDSSRPGYRGALFQINAKGAPIEFSYNRIETPNTFLWRAADIRRSATNRLVTSLLQSAPKVPRVIFCLAEEVESELFCQDISVSVPVCRVVSSMQTTPYSTLETAEQVDESEPLHLFWFPSPPPQDSVERNLLNRLVQSGLLLEPFKRAALGLKEVYQGEATH